MTISPTFTLLLAAYLRHFSIFPGDAQMEDCRHLRSKELGKDVLAPGHNQLPHYRFTEAGRPRGGGHCNAHVADRAIATPCSRSQSNPGQGWHRDTASMTRFFENATLPKVR
ncbi:hypothetical protein QR685DRAFT_61506 [Neurospora intermedia]|uniref:Secreted protein n=1 Tax=Neurospora intermedia TaxID=5142 RepID=A0ABR3DU76_NEUIN